MEIAATFIYSICNKAEYVLQQRSAADYFIDTPSLSVILLYLLLKKIQRFKKQMAATIFTINNISVSMHWFASVFLVFNTSNKQFDNI